MSDDQGGRFKIFLNGCKKGVDTVIQIIEALSSGWPERRNFFPPLLEQLGQGFLDMIKGFSIPGAQVDFIEPGIDADFFFRVDKGCCIPAPQEAAGINFAKPDVGKSFFPEQCLGYACFIQRNICLTDEALGLMSLYLSVAQQEEPWAVIGELFGWIGL